MRIFNDIRFVEYVVGQSFEETRHAVFQYFAPWAEDCRCWADFCSDADKVMLVTACSVQRHKGMAIISQSSWLFKKYVEKALDVRLASAFRYQHASVHIDPVVSKIHPVHLWIHPQ